MKLSRVGCFSCFLAFIFPIGGLLVALFKIDKKNATIMNIAISIAVFSIITTIPPYQDLYRRYLDTYLLYGNSTTYTEAISGHVDVLMYIVSLFLKKHDIPFYIFPAFQASIVSFLFLSSIKDFVDSLDINYRESNYAFIISFLFINLIAGALGLRFYLAVALCTKSLTLFFFRSKSKTAYVLMLLSVLFHFSLIFPIAAFFASRFIRINTKFVPILFIVGFLVGTIFFEYILNTGILGFVGTYIKAGYIDFSGNAEIDTKGNALIVTIWRYLVLLIIYIPCYLARKRESLATEPAKSYINFVGIFLITTSLTSISATAFNRYMISVGSFLVLINFFIVVKDRLKYFLKVSFLSIFLLNFVFQNIYLQRRPILLGEMWTGLYMPVPVAITRTDYEFKILLNQIDSDGDWVKDKLAVK